MGVYIPGMEMPTNRSRWIVIYPDGKVEYSDKTDEWETLDKGAVPVPPHGRLGDLDALEEKAIKRSTRGVCVNVLDKVITAYDIETAPTVIPATKEG